MAEAGSYRQLRIYDTGANLCRNQVADRPVMLVHCRMARARNILTAARHDGHGKEKEQKTKSVLALCQHYLIPINKLWLKHI